jgi:hypothetical protein
MAWSETMPQRAAADEPPADVIKRAIEAHGGMERLSKIQADWFKIKGWISSDGSKGRPFTAETFVQLPDQLKSVIELAGDDRKVTVVQTVDGDTAWVTIDGVPQAKINASALAEMRAVQHLDRITRLVPLLTDKKYDVSALGESKVNGQTAIGIKVQCKGHREVRLFFDKNTNLLVKAEHRLDDRRNKEVRQEEYYSDFKEFAGFKRPTKLSVYRDGKKMMEAELVEVKYYERFGEKIFAKP